MTYNPYPPPPAPQPKKGKAGKIVGLGCAGVVALAVFGGCVAALSSSDDNSAKNGAAPVVKHPAAKGQPEKAAPQPKKKKKKTKPHPKTVVFKVWGDAPAGYLGSLDIGYGSDSDTRKGSFKDGSFTATLPLDGDAMWYQVNAQLQGSGDIHCSVTVDGKTKNGHASGGYNICDAQLSSGLFGDWD